jgi:two-component system, chemotaxis family, chemotaxis protein CheY
MRILIVEDEVSNRLLLQRYLRGLHSVDVVVNGEEALEAFRLAHKDGDPYQLVLLDIQMPVMDGLEALRAIREMEKSLVVPSGQEAKVLMITAHNDKESVFDAFFKGNASGYLVKPVERETLLDCIAGFERV